MTIRTLDDILSSRARTRKTVDWLPKVTFGAALVATLAAASMKADIIKMYDVLQEARVPRAEYVRLQNEYTELSGAVTEMEEEVRSVRENGFAYVQPCYERIEDNSYEVEPCSTTRTE